MIYEALMILDDPMYMTLNLCRVLAYVRDGLILSKKAGGERGVRHLPEEWGVLVEKALRCYGTDEEMTARPDKARRFAGHMIEEIKNYV